MYSFRCLLEFCLNIVMRREWSGSAMDWILSWGNSGITFSSNSRVRMISRRRGVQKSTLSSRIRANGERALLWNWNQADFVASRNGVHPFREVRGSIAGRSEWRVLFFLFRLVRYGYGFFLLPRGSLPFWFFQDLFSSGWCFNCALFNCRHDDFF